MHDAPHNFCMNTKFENAACVQEMIRACESGLVKAFGELGARVAHASKHYPGGSLTIGVALSRIISEVEDIFELRTLTEASCCEDAGSILSMFLYRFRKRMAVPLAGLQASLLLSNVSPNIPPEGLRGAHFHYDKGEHRAKIIAWFLQRLTHEQEGVRQLRFAEIGVYRGDTSAYVLEHISTAKVWSIDP